ncbi:MAG: hypothetical protein GXO74_01170 [Calditrichaeota bacterium]|nr:hypothetical protein [Calditrichota bacterium]
MKTGKYSIGIFIFIFLVAGFFATVLAQEQKKSVFDVAKIDTSIWKYLRASDRTNWQITPEDSQTAYRDYFLPGYYLYLDVTKIFSKISKKRTTYAESADKLIDLLEQTQTYFEETARLNPFAKNLQLALRNVYLYLDGLYKFKKEDEKRYPILLKRLILETDRKKRIVIYNSLSQLMNSQQMFPQEEKYSQTEIDLIFEDDFSKIDTVQLFSALYQRGFAQYKMHKGDEALTSFRRAITIAPNDKWKKAIAGYIRLIDWDRGNIESAEYYSQAMGLIREKKYASASEKLQNALNVVATQKARRTIQFQLAFLEFYQLGKKAEGINRLWVQNKILASLPDSSASMDSTKSLYFNRYAQMCFRLAGESMQKDRKRAFFYFYQITTFDNSLKGRAYYYLASLSLLNQDQCLKFCQKANQYWDELEKSEQSGLATLFYRVYSSKGNFDEALNWFKKAHFLKQS